MSESPAWLPRDELSASQDRVQRTRVVLLPAHRHPDIPIEPRPKRARASARRTGDQSVARPAQGRSFAPRVNPKTNRLLSSYSPRTLLVRTFALPRLT